MHGKLTSKNEHVYVQPGKTSQYTFFYDAARLSNR